MGIIANSSTDLEALSYNPDESARLVSQRDVAIKKYAKQFTRFFMKHHRKKCEEGLPEDSLSCSERGDTHSNMVQKDRERLARQPEKREVQSSVGTTRRTTWNLKSKTAAYKQRDFS